MDGHSPTNDEQLEGQEHPVGRATTTSKRAIRRKVIIAICGATAFVVSAFAVRRRRTRCCQSYEGKKHPLAIMLSLYNEDDQQDSGVLFSLEGDASVSSLSSSSSFVVWTSDFDLNIDESQLKEELEIA